MVPEIVATITGYDIQVMMSFRPYLARLEQGTFKRIVRISDILGCEDCTQAVLVKCLIVRHKGHFTVLNEGEILMYLTLRSTNVSITR